MQNSPKIRGISEGCLSRQLEVRARFSMAKVQELRMREDYGFKKHPQWRTNAAMQDGEPGLVRHCAVFCEMARAEAGEYTNPKAVRLRPWERGVARGYQQQNTQIRRTQSCNTAGRSMVKFQALQNDSTGLSSTALSLFQV